MKIISYNIHNGFYAMGHETKDGFWTSEGKFNFVPFLKWVKKEDPDVILLQELTFRGVTKIKFEADMKKLGFVHIAYGFAADLYGEGGENFFGQATCSKIPFEKTASLKLKAFRGEARNALFTYFPDLVLVNTHLDVWDKTGETRLAEMKQIVKKIGTSKTAALLCGDFNTQRREDYTASQWKELGKRNERGA